jgi:hypothetical protein
MSRQRRGKTTETRGKARVGVSARATNGVDYRGATKAGCSSGKWAWKERAGAKTLSRALRKSGSKGKGVREYRCPECDRWHVGHLPFEAKRGHRSARDVYGLD